MDVGPGHTEAVFPQDNFLLQAEERPVTTFTGVTFSVNVNLDRHEGFTNDSVSSVEGTESPSDSTASISLPESLFDDLSLTQTNATTVRLVYSVFVDDALFQPRPESPSAQTFEGFAVGSVLISAAVATGSPVQDLRDPVRMTLQKNRVCDISTMTSWMLQY